MTKKLKPPRNPAKPASRRRRVMCFTSVALLAAWLGAPEAQAGSWTNLSSGLSGGGVAISLAFDTNGNLYAGGSFTTAGGVAATNVAKWNGSAWTNLGSGLDGVAYDLEFDTNGNLYAGGDFTTAGGRAATNIAKWNRTAWTNLGLGINGDVWSLARGTNGNLYAGGDFTTAGGVAATNVAKWNGTAWTNLGLGINGTVLSLAYGTNGNLYAGGQFTTAGGVTANYIAKWNGSSWTNLGSGLDGVAYGLEFDTDGNLYAGGIFTTAGGVAATNVAKWSGTAWTNLGSGLKPWGGGRVARALAHDTHGNLYAGGDFTTAGDRAATNVAKWNGSSWTNIGLGMNGDVWSLACDTSGNLYAGGQFTTAGGVAANYIAKWALGIEIIPDALTYTADQDGANPSNQAFVVTNEGPAAFTFSNAVTYSAGASGWFTNSVTTGLVSAAGTLAVTGSVNVAGLNAGMYYATNTFTATNAANGPKTMVVTLQVRNPARLWVSPTNFQKEITVGQTLAGDVFQVANTGAALSEMQYNVAATSLNSTAWLDASPTDGVVQAGSSKSVTMTYDTTGRLAGWHTGRVDVAAQGEGVGTQSVYVVLRVNHRPGVAWNAQGWTNEILAGGSLADTTFAVSNASGEPVGRMNYTVSVIDPSGLGWVSVSPASGVSTGEPQSVTLSYTTAGLAEGEYTVQLKVAGTDEATGIATTNDPLYMGLKLTVKNTPVLKVSVSSLSQTLLENLTSTTWFSITNDGLLPHGTMNYTITTVPAVEWARVSPSSGNVINSAAEIKVSWDSGGLSQGVYTSALTVVAVDAQHPAESVSGSPSVIPLTLTVASRTPQNMELPTVAGTMYIGQTVEANVGLWQNQERLTFGYQWERANKAGAGCETLDGKVSYTNDITPADRGKYLRVKVTATDSNPSPKSYTAYSAWTNSAKVKALSTDFNGDGITDLWFYNVLSGAWHASFGEASSAEGIFPGGPGMLAVPGDYDGDGYEDLGVYDVAHGMWHILFLWRCEYVYGSLFGGTAEEAAATPVVADYDGDGATDVGLYYMGYWAILYSSLGSLSVIEPFAEAWGEPVSGDWDGDGITEMGVYNDGVWTLRMVNGSVVVQEFGGGGSGVLPAPADYDADGATDLGVYDVGANQWRWRESRTGFEQNVRFGSGGNVAIPGYYDHDRSNDWAQAHMSADNDIIVWEVKRTTETNFLYRGQSFQQSTDRWRVSW